MKETSRADKGLPWPELLLPLFLFYTSSSSSPSSSSSGHHLAAGPGWFIFQLLCAVGATLVFLALPQFKGCFRAGEFGVFAFLFWKWMHYCSSAAGLFWPRFFLAAFLACLVHPLLTVLVLPFIPFAGLLRLILRDGRLLLLWPAELVAIGFFSASSFPSRLSTNTLRKVYHFAAVALFTPALLWHPELLSVALGFALVLFFVVERLRTLRLIRSRQLDSFMQRCRSERDTGQMTLSHLYLMLGCALPVWLHGGSGSGSGGDCLSQQMAGIISLGLGDSIAALVGRSIGRHPLSSRSNKTVEGTAAAVLAIFAALRLTGLPWRKALLVAMGAAGWESMTELNDNLTLPLVTFYLINALV